MGEVVGEEALIMEKAQKSNSSSEDGVVHENPPRKEGAEVCDGTGTVTAELDRRSSATGIILYFLSGGC